MKMIILALAAVILLGGGGAGAYFFLFSQPAEASAGEQVEEKSKKKKEKDDHNKHAEFVELDPLVLPIVDNDGVSQTVSVVVALEVHDPAASVKVKSIKPKLTDAYIENMYGMLNEHAALKGGVIQVALIKQELTRITDGLLGDDVVHGVLLQVVQQRPI